MVKGAVVPLLINQASLDPRFKDHPGLHKYGIESYIAVPLNRRDGSYFGTLCALDPMAATLTEDDFTIFYLLAHLISFELEADEQQHQREAELHGLEDLIAIAGHDLRQPLQVLSGRLQLFSRRIQRGVTGEELTKGVQELLTQTRRAMLLSNMLLDVARFQARSFALDLTEFDLVKLVMQLLDDARVLAPKHTFLLDAPATLPLVADTNRLAQVVANLLGNAVKYAPADRGPVVLQIVVEATAVPATQVKVRVQDCGPGVETAELKQLFGRQYRTAAARNAGMNGSGLGLYIAEQIIAAHGGAIWAENNPTGGLSVLFTLPLIDPDQASGDRSSQ